MSSLYISRELEKTIRAVNEAPWENKAFYLDWLAQTYHYTRYSPRALAMAAGWSGIEDRKLFDGSLKHLKEEEGHEFAAVDDIRILGGGNIEDYRRHGITGALAQVQFENLLRNPYYLMGTILPLETLVVETFRPIYQRLIKVYPGEACKMVKIHMDDDPDHVAKGLEQIERCSPEIRKEILSTYDQTAELYRLMIQVIRENTGT